MSRFSAFPLRVLSLTGLVLLLGAGAASAQSTWNNYQGDPSLHRPSTLTTDSPRSYSGWNPGPSNVAYGTPQSPGPADWYSAEPAAGYHGGGKTGPSYPVTSNQNFPSCYWSMNGCDSGCGVNWYGNLGYLHMTRDDSQNLWLSYDTDNRPLQLLNTRDAEWDWTSGFEVTLARATNCGSGVYEWRYWGLVNSTTEANAFGDQAVGSFDTVLDFTPLVYHNGTVAATVGSYFVDAERHRLRRSHQLHNFEWNFVRHVASTYPDDWACHPWRFQWDAGLRYIRFDEGLQYATDGLNRTFGDQPEAELYYGIDVENHLVGPQLGGRFDYCFSPRVNFHTAGHVGVFYNHVRHAQFIGGANGAAFIDEPGGPFDGEAYDILESKEDIAMVAELQTGMSYQLNCHWSLQLGYRIFALSGVAVASEQVPPFFEDLGTAQDVNSASSVLYHGGFGSLEFVY